MGKELEKKVTIVDSVMARITEIQNTGVQIVPKNYAAAAQLQLAYLKLTEVDNKGKTLIGTCSKDSIAQTLFRMVLEGMDISKDQCWFIPYGGKLQFQRSYFGDIALALKTNVITTTPTVQIVYKEDEFDSTVDVQTGKNVILKHKPNIFERTDKSKPVGAYCVLQLADGTTEIVIMNMFEIQKSWSMSKMPTSPAHKNFDTEMMKRTIIRRALKPYIKSTDDAYFIEKPFFDEPEEENQVTKRGRPKKVVADDIFASATEAEIIEENQQQTEPEKEEAPEVKDEPAPTVGEQSLDYSEEKDDTVPF